MAVRREEEEEKEDSHDRTKGEEKIMKRETRGERGF